MSKANEFHIKTPARASIWYIASGILGRGAGLLFTPIFTRLLTEEQYGRYSLYLTWLGIFTIISTLEINGGIYMRVLQKTRDRYTLFRSACLLEFAITATICILYFTFLDISQKITGLTTEFSILIFVQIFLSSIVNLYLATSKFYYKYKTVFLLNLAVGVLPVLLTVFLMYSSPLNAYSRAVATITVTAAASVFIIYNMSRGKISVSLSYMKELFLRGGGHILHFLSVALVGRADKLTVSSVFGTAALARYSVADTVGSLIILILTAVFSALTPWIMRRLSAGEEKRIREVGSLGARLVLWLSLILLALSPEIITALAPKEYGDALFSVYPIAISAVPAFLFTIAASAMMHSSHGILSVIPAVLGAASAFISAFLLSRFPHFTTVAFTQPTAQLVMLLLAWRILERRGVRIVDIENALTVLIVGFIGAISLFVMKDAFVLRVVIIAILLVPLIFEFGRCAVLVREPPEKASA